MTLQDSFVLAWRTVKSNKLRTGITVAIIAFGIMALIGIITAISAMNQSLKENFSFMGANAFSIRYKEMNARMGGPPQGEEFSKSKKGKKEKKSNLDKVIRLEESTYFKEHYGFNRAQVSVYRRGNGNNEIHYKNKKTNPQIAMFGADENYLAVSGYTLASGRNLNAVDLQSGRNVAVIGSNVAAKLNPARPEKMLDKIILVSGKPYRVVGLLKSKGSSAMLRQDDVLITSVKNLRQYQINNSYQIGVMVNNVAELEPAIGEATDQMRKARRLIPTEAENFVIDKSDKFAEMFIGFLAGISGAAGAIGMITLIGAAIGLMNIMLVAVNERTREVGLIKALGGKKKDVRRQFLFESILISILGAIFGIILGVLVGNIFSIVLGTGFVIPWMWVAIGIIICTVVGLVAGIYPAMKAASLNPINALRYE
ncbi:MAG: ABC transporter permease [Chitinophagaceae bacterium]|jgi:putative ABC transport system permease protein|nr:ABC transporter permease [Sediminibacterium sp.]